MKKIIDMDAIFDKYVSDYVYKNIGKTNPDEIEDNIPRLYEEFGNQKLEELDGKTPNTYYSDYTDIELIECLKEHIEKGVSVSDFLCEAIQSNPLNEDALCKELLNDNGEELTLYLMNLLDGLKSSKCVKRYLEFIIWDYSQPIKELAN